jgi:hypothetical protein
MCLKTVLRTKHKSIYRHNGDDVNVRDGLKLESLYFFSFRNFVLEDNANIALLS